MPRGVVKLGGVEARGTNHDDQGPSGTGQPGDSRSKPHTAVRGDARGLVLGRSAFAGSGRGGRVPSSSDRPGRRAGRGGEGGVAGLRSRPAERGVFFLKLIGVSCQM